MKKRCSAQYASLSPNTQSTISSIKIINVLPVGNPPFVILVIIVSKVLKNVASADVRPGIIMGDNATTSDLARRIGLVEDIGVIVFFNLFCSTSLPFRPVHYQAAIVHTIMTHYKTSALKGINPLAFQVTIFNKYELLASPVRVVRPGTMPPILPIPVCMHDLNRTRIVPVA